MLAQPAAAQLEATLPLKLALVLGGSVTWDANLFRLPGSANPLLAVGKPNKDDRITTTYVGLRIDKSLAQQRFQLDVTKTTYRYNSYTFLDFDALDYRGAWLWQLTPRLSGTLSAEHRQALVPFADFRGFQRNISNTDRRSFNLDGWLVGGWHLLLGVFDGETKYSQVFLPQTSSRSNGAEAGVRYVAASGSSITATRRSSRGKTINQPLDPVSFIDDGFRIQESELQSTWLMSGKSTFNGRLDWVQRRHEHFTQRDFSGMAGNLDYTWTPTGKLRLAFSARRDISAYWDARSSYVVSDALSVTPTWQASTRTVLRMRLDCSQRDYRGPVIANPGPLRGETVCSAGLGADWTPLRYVTFSANLQRDRRSSNYSAFEFDDTIAVISASLAF
jgi:exopolysaccharide biosynthesis operon protein EpsL